MDFKLDFKSNEDHRKDIDSRLTASCAVPIYLDIFQHRFKFIEDKVAEHIRTNAESKFITNEQYEFQTNVQSILSNRRSELQQKGKNAIMNMAQFFQKKVANTKVDESESDEDGSDETEFQTEVNRELKTFKIIRKNLDSNPPIFTDKCEQKLFESDRGPQSQMEFWSSKEKFMPILASLALNFGSIPTSTSIVESSFLHANNFRKDDRNRLSQEHTNDQLVIYYDNLMNN